VVAWNTLHIGAIVGQLRAEGQVIDERYFGPHDPEVANTHMTKMTNPIPEATIVRIVQSYYDAVDSLDADRIGGLYLPEPSTTQFNADSPIVSVEAIKAFSARGCRWYQTLDDRNLDDPAKWQPCACGPARPALQLPRHCCIYCLPIFSIRNASGVMRLP